MAVEPKPKTRVLPFEAPDGFGEPVPSADEGNANRNSSRKPRRVRRYTGEHLLDKLPVMEAMLGNSTSVNKVSKVLRVSRNSVQAVKQRMQRENCLSPKQAEREQLRHGIHERFAALVGRSLGAVSSHKLRKAGAYELVKVASICAQQAGLTDAPSSLSFNWIQNNFGLHPSQNISVKPPPPVIDLAPCKAPDESERSPDR